MNSMRALALIGSPRKRGNSDLLADEVLRGMKDEGADVEKIYLDDCAIRPIAEVCDDTRTREDPRDGDDLPGVLSRFLEADLVILATPVYWAGVCAQLKCFIDRLSSYFRREPYSGSFQGKGYVIVATFGRNEPDHGKWVTSPLRLCVDVLGGVYLGDLCVSAYEKGKVKEMPHALRSARELGKKAVRELSKRHGPGP
jgi:multimeric flavodoxin WrbA